MRFVRLSVALLAMAAIAAFAAPQSTTPAKRPTTTPPAPAAKQLPKMTDAQLEAAIRAKFAKSKINEDKFTVRVQGGVAHIDGKTAVLQHKGVATKMARSLGAVVDNRIQVDQEAKDKAAGNLDQGRRRVQVKHGDTRSEDRSSK